MPPSKDSRRDPPTTTATMLVVAAAAAATATGLVAFSLWRARRAKRAGEWASRGQNVVWRKSLEELPIEAPVPVVDGAYLLAEGPVWCPEREELWWVGELFLVGSCVCACVRACVRATTFSRFGWCVRVFVCALAKEKCLFSRS